MGRVFRCPLYTHTELRLGSKCEWIAGGCIKKTVSWVCRIDWRKKGAQANAEQLSKLLLCLSSEQQCSPTSMQKCTCRHAVFRSIGKTLSFIAVVVVSRQGGCYIGSLTFFLFLFTKASRKIVLIGRISHVSGAIATDT